jgi:hypothetical protein
LSKTFAAVSVGIVAFGVYAPNLGNGFAMDDRYNVVENEAIRDLTRIPSLYLEPWGAHAPSAFDRVLAENYYRPTSLASYAIDYALWGLSPLGFHLTNDLLHALAAVLVFLLLHRLLGEIWPAVFGALLFAVHPAGSEAVSLITYRTTLLGTVFTLVALQSHLRGGRLALFVTPLFYALGVTSKEEAVCLPALLFSFDVALGGGGSWKRRIGVYAPLALVLVGYFLVRWQLLGPQRLPYFGDAGAEVIAPTMIGVYGLYWEILLAPVRLCTFYDWSLVPPVADPLSGTVLRGLCFALLGLAALAVAWKKSRIVFAGLAFWHIALLPLMYLLPMPIAAAERFLYLPMVGLTLAAAVGMRAFSRRWRRLAVALAALALGAFSVRSALRTLDFKDDLTLRERTAADWPESFNARFLLARSYREMGRGADALREIRAALEIAPGFPPAEKELRRILSASNAGLGR